MSNSNNVTYIITAIVQVIFTRQSLKKLVGAPEALGVVYDRKRGNKEAVPNKLVRLIHGESYYFFLMQFFQL